MNIYIQPINPYTVISPDNNIVLVKKKSDIAKDDVIATVFMDDPQNKDLNWSWTRNPNVNIGDTILIYVSGKTGKICFKTEVVDAWLVPNSKRKWQAKLEIIKRLSDQEREALSYFNLKIIKKDISIQRMFRLNTPSNKTLKDHILKYI